ncbi:IQ domain-containing protein H-like isoform X3 [Mercenaria mercenaria]|uniref:IQ domain-containing protein H-like isoform X3 n=1 Tax=Mercenaria mercenaria TaxID=6596 RepID=UPI00234F7C45|nr:IQ domain-containing protein H-like isoform X3 [Mercenaria mercenaria]
MSISNEGLPLLRAPLPGGDYKAKKFSGFQNFLPQIALVQDDIRQLRENLTNKGDGKGITIEELENALNKTEKGLQQKAEQMLSQLNNQVQTLPSADAIQAPGFMALESTWDLKKQTRGQHRIEMSQAYVPREKLRQPQPAGALLPLRKGEPTQLQGLSPGQQSKQTLALRAVYNPHSQQNRPVMNENFGIMLPLIPQSKEKKPPPKPVMGSTIEPLAVLPKANRVDAQLAPPPITEDDARKGILSLIERGLIPPAAQLTLDPSPVKNRMVPLHNPEDRNKPPCTPEIAPTLAGVKLDLVTKNYESATETMAKMPVIPPHPQSVNSLGLSRTTSGKTRTTSAASSQKAKTPATMKTYEMPIQPLQQPHRKKFLLIKIPNSRPPPTTPASGDFKMISHRFAVQNGRIRDTSSEFLSFKQHYCLTWGSIVTVLKHLEKMLNNFAVPVAFINGDRLADLAEEFELERPPSIDDLLSCIVNRDDVENIIFKPGRRFKGPNGRDIASAKIQATWKMYRERSTYLEYRRRKWAAGVIAISWIMHIKMAKVRQQLKQVRLDNLENFRRRAKKFSMSWDRIKKSKRVIIHIPSLGLNQDIRDSIHDFGIRQNTQMSRLCDIRDPNVDVIFISPVPLSEETLQYYSKLLGLKSAIDSGNVEDQGEFSDRYKIIVPEAIKSFPTHRMCLSTLLKYSPQALFRVKNLIKGREAYMMTNVPHVDDLDIAQYLNVPIFAPEPEVAHLYSTKSGCQRIFASANVETPPGDHDVYTMGLLHECLAQLITENLNVKRWLFKLDDEFDGRGIAYCDVTEHLKCFTWAQKEEKRYGDKWSKKWAQEPVFIKILAEIEDVLKNHACPVNTKVYPTWDKFLQSFLSQGGVIEACPPSDSITTLTVDMLIEPNGAVSIVSCGDQIHAESPFSCWGVSIPQSSVEPDVLNVACYNIAESCKRRGIMGYFAIDFVTFIHPTTMEQKLWALDISLQYSDSLAMFYLMQFVSNGTLNTKTHVFDVPPPKQEAKKRRRRLHGQDEEQPPNTNRFGVMSTRLLHTNLSVVHYSVFFQMCRAHGIGYDIKEKQGTVFMLIDSFNREKLGMLAIGETLQGALASFARNMSVIHQEISAPNMQGDTNFSRAISDIEGILGTTIQNADEADEETEGSNESK